MYQIVNFYLSSIMTILSSVYFVKIITHQRFTRKKRIVLGYILLEAILFTFLFSLKLTAFKTELEFFLYLLLFKFLFSLDIVKVFILDFFYFIILIISDICSIVFFILCFGENLFYQKIAGTFLGSFVVFLLVVIFSSLFKKVINKFLNVKIKYKLSVMLIVSIFLIIKLFYSTFAMGVTILDQAFCMLCIIIIVLITGYTFLQLFRYQQLLIKYDSLLSFLKKYEMELENQRILCHENKNQLLIIKSKIMDKENNNEILKYIDALINDNSRIRHLEYLKFKYLPSNGIRGLFYFKLSVAQDKGIKISINISKEIENSFLSNLNMNNFSQLVKILSIYLDNAIEGAEVSKEKNMGIEIYKQKDLIKFIISNTFNKSVKSFGRSTKGKTRGHGLILANNLISNNSKFSSLVEITDNLYVTKLTIKK